MTRTPLFDALTAYEKQSKGYFRIPGHRFELGIPKTFIDFAGKNIFRLDVTETPMTDDLHNPESVIAASQKFTAEAFNAAQSFYLVNGTTCGNEAMIIASASDGEEILIPRNAHKSVMAGLIISGAKPVYMPVEYIEKIGLTGVLKPETAEKLLSEHPESKAVFAVSPSYHGFCSDIEALAKTAHRHGVPLLVDEAHGAHFYFCSSLPDGALTLGADACAQSMHKTTGALTQSSLLHLAKTAQCGLPLIDPAGIDSALRMTMSTSPSYLLMSSLELARADMELNGEEYWNKTIDLTRKTRRGIEAKTDFRCPSDELLLSSEITNLDPTRLIINCDNTAVSGWELKTLLWDKYYIDAEMADERNILLLFTYGNTEAEASDLISALEKITADTGKYDSKISLKKAASPDNPEIPEMILTPREAYFSGSKLIPWKEMTGKITSEAVSPYPPGIPVVYPGEIITEEIFYYLDSMKKQNRHLHGLSDKSLSSILVCDY